MTGSPFAENVRQGDRGVHRLVAGQGPSSQAGDPGHSEVGHASGSRCSRGAGPSFPPPRGRHTRRATPNATRLPGCRHETAGHPCSHTWYSLPEVRPSAERSRAGWCPPRGPARAAARTEVTNRQEGMAPPLGSQQCLDLRRMARQLHLTSCAPPWRYPPQAPHQHRLVVSAGGDPRGLLQSRVSAGHRRGNRTWAAVIPARRQHLCPKRTTSPMIQPTHRHQHVGQVHLASRRKPGAFAGQRPRSAGDLARSSWVRHPRRPPIEATRPRHHTTHIGGNSSHDDPLALFLRPSLGGRHRHCRFEHREGTSLAGRASALFVTFRHIHVSK